MKLVIQWSIFIFRHILKFVFIMNSSQDDKEEEEVKENDEEEDNVNEQETSGSQSDTNSLESPEVKDYQKNFFLCKIWKNMKKWKTDSSTL